MGPDLLLVGRRLVQHLGDTNQKDAVAHPSVPETVPVPSIHCDMCGEGWHDQPE